MSATTDRRFQITARVAQMLAGDMGGPEAAREIIIHWNGLSATEKSRAYDAGLSDVKTTTLATNVNLKILGGFTGRGASLATAAVLAYEWATAPQRAIDRKAALDAEAAVCDGCGETGVRKNMYSANGHAIYCRPCALG